MGVSPRGSVPREGRAGSSCGQLATDHTPTPPCTSRQAFFFLSPAVASFPSRPQGPAGHPWGPARGKQRGTFFLLLAGNSSLSLTHAKGMWGLGAGHGTDRRAPGAQGQGGGAWQSPMALRPPEAAPSAATCGPLGFRSYGHTDHFLEAVTVRTEDRVMCGAQQ